MDFKQLEAFVYVVKLKSFSKAAQRIYLTPVSYTHLDVYKRQDRHYANHYATIKKWLDEDSKGRSAKNYTYDDNEGECL